ncbi:CBL-interacting serine/threonine-protein kinase 1, partial [Trifolium medium]|nr:CBL-interacting serine/threonine-protein kinase 1 [Trifolium medium]
MAGIKEDLWFKEGYNQADPEDEEEDVYVDDQVFSAHEL